MPLKLARALYLTALAASALVLPSCSGGSSACGPTVERSSGGHWVCTFADDFSGTTLDRSHWRVTRTAAIGFTQSAGECYVDDPQHVRVANGLLKLTATRLPRPARCGPYATRYRSGMVFSKDRFAQTYGRFEVRAKLPRGVGFQPALWMYPQDLAYGRRSGEIDIAESFGAADTVSPHIHMRDPAGIDHPRGANCHVADPSGSFHTYTVQWAPSSISFLYDGVPCMTVSHWRPQAPLVFPQPFDKPFFMLLQLGLGYSANAPSAATPFPGEMQIDYVRAWR